jgi:hypothetical protein
MDLICYLHPGWAPLIRPAPATRAWMDATPASFAYRCLPLDIANAHGWEVLSPCGFEAVWDGDPDPRGVTVTLDPGAPVDQAPVSLFGQGVLTFHVAGIFRTPPGWNLWVSGSPNRPRDGLFPLTGVIETDWSPFTFTMNWRFTRPGLSVRFEALEPFCFLFPVQRGAIEAFEPRLAPMAQEPELMERFMLWSRNRDAFHEQMRRDPPKIASAHWQKHYYRGVDASGEAHVEDHKAKLRLKPFDASATPEIPAAPASDAPSVPSAPARDEAMLALRRREWLLETLERQRALAASAIAIERRSGLGAEAFLERHYAVNRPVILTGEMDDWPALRLWTADGLKARADDGLAGLQEDLGFLDRFLTREADDPHGAIRIEPAGAFTSLRPEPANALIAQILGRTRFKLVPAAQAGSLYDASPPPDLDDPAIDLARYPRLRNVRAYDVVLEPGEILFTPLAWWRQARSLDFSVTITSTNFRWPNDAAADFPG